MTRSHHLLAAAATASLVSCASQSGGNYDTSNPYGATDPSMAAQPENPVYDTPAAYGDTAYGNTPYSDNPAIEPAPFIDEPSYTPEPEPAPTRTATIHTVVKGDTLSGLSAKYNVSMDAIKRANNMTNDIVVLGRKMVIPAR